AGGLCCLPKDPAPERVRGECAAAEAPVPAVRLERPRPRTMESTEWRSLAEANRNEGDALVGTCGRYPDRGALECPGHLRPDRRRAGGRAAAGRPPGPVGLAVRGGRGGHGGALPAVAPGP